MKYSFTVDVPDDEVPGITAAKDAFNASLPVPKDDKGVPTGEHDPAWIEDDTDYLVSRIEPMILNAIASYAVTNKIPTKKGEGKARELYLSTVSMADRAAIAAAIESRLGSAEAVASVKP